MVLKIILGILSAIWVWFHAFAMFELANEGKTATAGVFFTGMCVFTAMVTYVMFL